MGGGGVSHDLHFSYKFFLKNALVRKVSTTSYVIFMGATGMNRLNRIHRIQLTELVKEYTNDRGIRWPG